MEEKRIAKSLGVVKTKTKNSPSAALLPRALGAVVLAVEVVRDDAPALGAVLLDESDDGVVLLPRPRAAFVGRPGSVSALGALLAHRGRGARSRW